MLHFPFFLLFQDHRHLFAGRQTYHPHHRQTGRFFYLYSHYSMAIEGKELAIACARAAEEIQAEDICVLDLTGVSSLTDFMVVCSGTSLPHLKAVMRDVENKIIEEYGVHTVNAEGNANSRWMVLDYIDVMVHIMHAELRDLYGLEDLWAEGKEVEWQEPEATGE
ncbi:MAG: ribosome silencing factor [Verrucomicrobiae bacterium]|nr:ribosome silencing factor [Verrucomicrobiae bacterium]NNJ86820.1 ribosome silencing factor [Akkermansiaceae bacterium]